VHNVLLSISQFSDNLGSATVVTSSAGVHEDDTQTMSHSKASLLGRPAYPPPPAYMSPRDGYDGLVEEKKSPPSKEDGGYGVGYGFMT
jgi:hypothetical protein